MLEEEKKIEENLDEENHKPLFTKSRILFLIVVLLVMSMPLLYRHFSYLII